VVNASYGRLDENGSTRKANGVERATDSLSIACAGPIHRATNASTDGASAMQLA
jgi:hypothetical protein